MLAHRLASLAEAVAAGTPALLADTFAGPLDTAFWTVEIKTTGSAVADNGLALTLSAGSAINNVRVRSPCLIPGAGLITLVVRWTPGSHHPGAGGMPYIALVPAVVDRWEGYLEASTCPYLRLGWSPDVYSRSGIEVGIQTHESYPHVVGANAGGSWPMGIPVDLVWVIDWVSSTMGLIVDGVELLTGVSFSYTPSGLMAVEFGNADYGYSDDRVEFFSNLVVTQS